jgi:hypothetical protein
MNRQARTAVLGCSLAAAVLGPATPAGAVGEQHAPTLGTIMVCSANNFDVYAEGPSFREDDLMEFNKHGECTDWKPVLPGNYEIGWASRVNGGYFVNIECLVRRGKSHVMYKRLNSEGHVYSTVAPGELTRVDLWIGHG